jgi:hypothetical protein
MTPQRDADELVTNLLPTGTRQTPPGPSSTSGQKIIGSRYSLHASGASELASVRTSRVNRHARWSSMLVITLEEHEEFIGDEREA